MQSVLEVVSEDESLKYQELLNFYCEYFPQVKDLLNRFSYKPLLFERLIVNEMQIPIGFITYGLSAYADIQRETYFELIILGVYVEESCRGKGYFNRVLDELKEYGIRMYLYVPNVDLVRPSTLFSRVGILL